MPSSASPSELDPQAIDVAAEPVLVVPSQALCAVDVLPLELIEE